MMPAPIITVAMGGQGWILGMGRCCGWRPGLWVGWKVVRELNPSGL